MTAPAGPGGDGSRALAARVVREASADGLTIAVAESLTGGLVSAALTSPPGASAAVLGGVVVYATELKQTLAGVGEELLRERGPVDPEVARALALGARRRLAVGGRRADLGVATTGVAGPEAQAGSPVGTVFVGVSSRAGERAVPLRLAGDRDAIRAGTVLAALGELAAELAALRGRPE